LGSVLGVPLRGFLAWWARRTYYLFQMPRFSRRVRIVVDWTLALCFRPDIVKFDLASERAQLERGHASGARPDAAGAHPPPPAAPPDL
jgi:NADH dehydrogenase